MASLAGSLFFYILLTTSTGDSSDNRSLSCGVIVSIYLFGMCFASGMTPYWTLYPAKCLENHTRAKGGYIKLLFVNIAMIVNTYGISIGIKEIAWKLYLLYIVWIRVELIIAY